MICGCIKFCKRRKWGFSQIEVSVENTDAEQATQSNHAREHSGPDPRGYANQAFQRGSIGDSLLCGY